jgi:hypothetical protein
LGNGSNLAELGHNAAMRALKLAALLFLSCSILTTASAGQTPKFQFSPGALLRAELDKTADANKAKAGDPIVLKLTDDLRWSFGVIAPKNSKIFGHVTEATQRRGDVPSVLGIAFDKLILKDGSEVTFKAIIQAIGIPGSGGGDWVSSGATTPGDVPGQVGGPTGTLGQPSGYYGGKMGGATSMGDAVNLSPNARGVIGIAGASLSTGSGDSSVISSSKRTVKIESGAQMILVVQ